MITNDELKLMRANYRRGTLDENEVGHDPLVFFKKWFKDAKECQVDEPNAFVLSTISNNHPRSRVLLLKEVQHNGFVFYTNYLSHKGSEIGVNPLAAMNFCWLPLERQVRIEGSLSKVSREQTEKYFSERPRGSQIGAHASIQSTKVPSREFLEEKFKLTEQTFKNDAIPCPENWGGYLLSVEYMEFWQGRENRLHDRIAFKKNDSGWDIYRLSP